MLFDNYILFIYVCLFVLAYNGVKYLTTNLYLRNLVILGANLLILLTLVKEHTLIVIAILGLLVYVAGIFLHKKKAKSLLFFALWLIITLFSIRNYPYIHESIETGWLSFIHAPIMSVKKLGLSYILFRS